MTLEAGKAYVEIVPRLAPGFAGQVAGDIDRATTPVLARVSSAFKSFGERMRSVGRTMITGVTLPIAAALGFMVKEAIDAEKIGRDTDAVIKSMGASSWTSRGQIEDLAESLSKKTAVDDEAIQAGENLLLTFGNIRNEVGAGNDIFNQATGVVVDFAARFGKDIPQSAILVGKALQDPIKGATALRRVGVQLTDQQQEQIKAFVESGDILSAQKIILGELTRETQGAAAAQATSWDKIKVAVGNAAESMGKILLPIIDTIANKLAGFAGWLENLDPHWQKLILGALGAVAALGPLAYIIGAISTILGVILTPIGLVVLAIAALVAGAVLLYLKWDEIWTAIANNPALMALAVIVGLVFGAVVLPIVAVIGIIKLLQAHWDTIWPALQAAAQSFLTWAEANIWPVLERVFTLVIAIINNAVTVITPIIQAFVAVVSFLWDNFGTHLITAFQNAWTLIVGVLEAVLQIISGILDVFIGIVTLDWSTAWAGIKEIFGGVWNLIVAILEFALATIQNQLSFALTFIQAVWSAAWNAVASFLSWAWSMIQSVVSAGISFVVFYFTELPGRVLGVLAGLPGMLWDLGSRALNAMRDGVANGFNAVRDWVAGIGLRVVNAIGDLGGLLLDAGKAVMRGFLDGIKAGFEKVKDFVGGIKDTITSIKGPRDVDLALLVPAGEAIMDGLERGLRARWPSVTDFVAGAGDELRAAFVSSTIGAGIGALGPDVAGGHGAPIHLEQHISFAAPPTEDELAEVTAATERGLLAALGAL